MSKIDGLPPEMYQRFWTLLGYVTLFVVIIITIEAYQIMKFTAEQFPSNGTLVLPIGSDVSMPNIPRTRGHAMTQMWTFEGVTDNSIVINLDPYTRGTNIKYYPISDVPLTIRVGTYNGKHRGTFKIIEVMRSPTRLVVEWKIE